MKVNFTKKQYQTLVKLVTLGEWMANSTKMEEEETNEDQELLHYVYSFAPSFGYEEMQYDKGLDKYFLTPEMEEHLHEFIDEYDEEVFWEQLRMRLAQRDVELEERLKPLNNPEERFKRVSEKEDQYFEHFDEHGLSKVRIDE